MNNPAFAPSRKTILAASEILKALGHSGLDKLLLELDTPDSVGRGYGLAARVVSLAKFALNNSDFTTPEGDAIGVSLVVAAIDIWKSSVNVNLGPQDRSTFEHALAKDGYAIANADGSLTLGGGVADDGWTNASMTFGADTLEKLKAAVIPVQNQVPPTKLNRKIFIVHGRQEGPRESIARFLEKIGFEVVILHEKANGGRTVIEKFELNSDTGYAIIILTPDDLGGLKGGKLQPRARQNVIMEWGYFIGKLARDRVCAILSENLELPTDIGGIAWLEYDSHAGWKSKLAKELEAAGYEIDHKKVNS